jgi:hypothetical protein
MINLATVLLISPVIASLISVVLVKLDAIGHGRHRSEIVKASRRNKGGLADLAIEMPEIKSRRSLDDDASLEINLKGRSENRVAEGKVSSSVSLSANGLGASSSGDSGSNGEGGGKAPDADDEAKDAKAAERNTPGTRPSSSARGIDGIATTPPVNDSSASIIPGGNAEQMMPQGPSEISDSLRGRAGRTEGSNPSTQSRALSQQILSVTAELSATRLEMENQQRQQLAKEQEDLAKHEQLKREIEKLLNTMTKKM